MNYKLSFCVVCMNRSHHLKQTLLRNIEACRDYSNLEFIVLDYNSIDDMEEWGKTNLAEYIKSGKVLYYKTLDPESWSPSHSKNLAFKLATGDILCSIWADYYTGLGFPQYVNECFNADSNIVLTPIDFHKTKKGYSPPGDVLGKVCVKKSDFMRVNGFDERMNKHGFEDYDFINRLEQKDVKRVLIEDHEYLQYLSHPEDERFDLQGNDLSDLYIHYLSPSESEILLLYKDFHFERGVVVDNSTVGSDRPESAYRKRHYNFEYSIKGMEFEKGYWTVRDKSMIILNSSEYKTSSALRKDSGDCLIEIESKSKFYNQLNENVIKDLLRFRHFMQTRIIMEENLANKMAVVNPNGFGKATVYKNFNSDVPISID